MSKSLSDEVIHSRISALINQNVSLDAEYWKNSRKQWESDALNPYTLYKSAYRMVREGKHFFGCGSWYEYMRRFHGVNSLSANNLPNERISIMIRQQVERIIQTGKFYNLGARAWQGDSAPTTSGRSLAALYSLAQARRVDGKTFLGYGNWRDYLISLEPKVAHGMPTYTPIIRGNTVTREQLDAVFRDAIARGLSLRPSDWLEYSTSKKSHVKPEYADLARARKILSTRRYLNHGSYAGYLLNVHKTNVPKKYIRRKGR